MQDSLLSLVALALLGALAAGIFRAVPLARAFRAVARTGRQASKVLRSSQISDHWKERTMRAYSARMLGATARVCGLLILVLGPVAILAWLLERTFLPGFMSFALSLPGLAAATLGAFLPAGLRRFRKPGPASSYSTVEKLLHRLALGTRSVAEASFDLDQSMTRTTRRDVTDGRHVFVVGLARAGTTALMRNIHDSGAFRSLLYEDMPFVLAPNLWRRLRGARQKAPDGPARERAHGDGLMVNSKSPESLDEVFWRVFDAESYITDDALMPHTPSPELRQKFRNYVSAILAAHPDKRYLSKNNNNLLRLDALHETFPNAHILVLVRHPLDHAASLWRQHLNFTAQQTQDPFAKSYMGWLAHHEFGADHRPFAPDAAQGATPDQPVYWLRQWIAVHQRLRATLPNAARLVCYEALCDDPAEWQDIARTIGLPAGTAQFHRAAQKRVEVFGCDEELRQAQQLYDDLRALSCRRAAVS